jgi:hypothetical protein
MLPQQVPAVVVTVRGAEDGVHVERLWLIIGQEDPRVAVELDEHDGAVHFVVESRVFLGRAHPGEIGLLVVPLDLLGTGGGRRGGQPSEVSVDHGHQQFALPHRHVGRAQALVREHHVVSAADGSHPSFSGVLQFRRKVTGKHGRVQDRDAQL